MDYVTTIMNKTIFSITIFFILNTVVGCMPRHLEPDAKNITIVYDQNTRIVKNCKFLGKISDEDVHGTKIQFTWGLEKNQILDDINFLKNEGRKFNANIVVFEKHQTLIKRYQHFSSIRHSDISIHSIEGSAYLCPTQMIATIKRLKIVNHSVYENPVIIKDESIIIANK